MSSSGAFFDHAIVLKLQDLPYLVRRGHLDIFSGGLEELFGFLVVRYWSLVTLFTFILSLSLYEWHLLPSPSQRKDEEAEAVSVSNSLMVFSVRCVTIPS